MYKTDEEIKEEYDSMHPVYSHTTPKQRKAKYLSRLKGWNERELMKLKSKQLTAILWETSTKKME